VTPHGEKVRAGQDRARARNIRIGRPMNPKLTPETLDRARAMRAAKMCLRDIAAELHVPTTTLHRALTREATP
jgi:DNA invertase Pin-like site-specific DNA recombinase